MIIKPIPRPALLDGSRQYIDREFTRYVLKADIPPQSKKTLMARIYLFLADPSEQNRRAVVDALDLHRIAVEAAPPPVHIDND